MTPPMTRRFWTLTALERTIDLRLLIQECTSVVQVFRGELFAKSPWTGTEARHPLTTSLFRTDFIYGGCRHYHIEALAQALR